ncbi:hypothetical protein [Chitinophaga sp. RAB17]|uniref:hypothetical protein n=1 Tax=Chitinophaga sp. RAB17 TaxID=3233049 RepID=UPI003F9194E3
MRRYFLAVLLLCAACTESSHQQKVISATPGAVTVTQPAVAHCDFVRLKNDSVRQLHFLNSDGSVWKKVLYNDYFSDSSIAPYAIKPENLLLIFRCLGKENGLYKVVVHEEKNIIRYISCKDSNFFSQSMQENILSACCVDFDAKSNPMREKPSIHAKLVAVDTGTDALNEIVKIEGDWLLIQKDTTQGWIKWRDEKGTLLIEIFYDA